MKIDNKREIFEYEGRTFDHTSAMYWQSRGFESYWQNARRELIEQLLAQLHDGCESLIDVGCAEGYFVAYARKIGYHAFGSELAKSKLQKGSNIGAVGDAQMLPLAGRSVDIVMLNRILEYVPDDKLALEEAARVGRRYLLVTVPVGNPAEVIQYSWGLKRRSYEPDVFRTMLEKYGSVVELRGVGVLGFIPKLWRLFVWFKLYSLPSFRVLDMTLARRKWLLPFSHELLALVEIAKQ
jgi:SAM-dependent methyltransferase